MENGEEPPMAQQAVVLSIGPIQTLSVSKRISFSVGSRTVGVDAHYGIDCSLHLSYHHENFGYYRACDLSFYWSSKYPKPILSVAVKPRGCLTIPQTEAVSDLAGVFFRRLFDLDFMDQPLELTLVNFIRGIPPCEFIDNLSESPT